MRPMLHLASYTLLLCAVLPCTASLTRAQCVPSLSFLANAPIGISFSSANPGMNPARPYFQPAGVAVMPPTVWSAGPTVPNFDLIPTLQSTACGAPAQLPDINAMSLGQDYLLIDDATGFLDIPINRWAVLQFSIRAGSAVAPGSRMQVETSDVDGGGMDVFTHALDGSALPPELVGETFRSHDARELGLAPTAREVDALDHFMSVYALDPTLAATAQAVPSVYFCLSNASLAQAPGSWFSVPGVPTLPSAATILRMTWRPHAQNWSCPRPFKLFFQLGLAQHEDIDALAVDIVRQRILFSTTTVARDELLFIPCSSTDGLPPVPKPLQDSDGKVETKIGILGDGDIDAVCGIDPSTRAGGLGPLNTWNYYCGAPSGPRYLPPQGSAQGSAFKTRGPGGNSMLRAQLMGFPPLTGEGPGLAFIAFSPPGSPGQLFPLGQFMRTFPVAACGDPQVWTLPIPAAAVLTNFEFDLRWVLVNSDLTEVYDTHPLRIRI